jgi:hypothetical protein
MDGARGVLQFVEQLRQLEREKFLRVEQCETIAAGELCQLTRGCGPERVQVFLGRVEFFRQPEQGCAGG